MQKLLLSFSVILLTACSPGVETIDLATVPDIPEDMIREQSSVHHELENDRKKTLEEIKNETN